MYGTVNNGEQKCLIIECINGSTLANIKHLNLNENKVNVKIEN